MSLFIKNCLVLARKLMGGDSLRAELVRGALGSFAIKIAALLTSFVSSVLLARMLGAHGLGIYAYAFTLVTLISVPLHMGLALLLVRDVSIYYANSRWSHLSGLLRSANLAVLSLSVMVVSGAAVVAWVSRNHIDGTLRQTFIWALILLPLYSLSSLRSAVLRGLRRVVIGQLPDQLLRPILLITGLAIWSLLAGQRVLGSLGPQQAMALHAVAAAVAFAAGAALLWKVLPLEVRHAKPAYEYKAWLRALAPLTLLSSINVLNNSTAIVLLGLFHSDDDVGRFRVAEQLATLVSFSLVALNVAVAPQIARLYSLKEMPKLQNMLSWSARIMFWAAIPAVIAFVILGKFLLSKVFGSEYEGAYPSLVILCCGQLVNAACGPVGLVLNMSGHEREVMVGALIAALVNIVLCLLLAPTYGASGVAMATAVSMTTWNLLLAWRVYVRTGLTTTIFGKGLVADAS